MRTIWLEGPAISLYGLLIAAFGSIVPKDLSVDFGFFVLGLAIMGLGLIVDKVRGNL